MHFYAESSSWSTEVLDNITHPRAPPGSEKKKKNNNNKPDMLCGLFSTLCVLKTDIACVPLQVQANSPLREHSLACLDTELQFEINRCELHDQSVS